MSLRFDRRMTEQEAMMLNPLQLAYLGDSVWELTVRVKLLMDRYNVHHLHQQAVARVNAGAQAAMAEQLLPCLTEAEKEIVRRGRNAHAKHPAPKNQKPDDYSLATGFEALWGYLYITGQDARIAALTEFLEKTEKNNG